MKGEQQMQIEKVYTDDVAKYYVVTYNDRTVKVTSLKKRIFDYIIGAKYRITATKGETFERIYTNSATIKDEWIRIFTYHDDIENIYLNDSLIYTKRE